MLEILKNLFLYPILIVNSDVTATIIENFCSIYTSEQTTTWLLHNNKEILLTMTHNHKYMIWSQIWSLSVDWYLTAGNIRCKSSPSKKFRAYESIPHWYVCTWSAELPLVYTCIYLHAEHSYYHYVKEIKLCNSYNMHGNEGLYGVYCIEARGLSAIYTMHPECTCYN